MCVSVRVPSFMCWAVNFVVNHVFDVVEWDMTAHQVAAHRSSFGELVCLFIAPMSCVNKRFSSYNEISISLYDLYFSQ